MSTVDHHAPAGVDHPRPIHLVGSLPAPLSQSDESGMQWSLDHAGTASLTTLPSERESLSDWLSSRHHAPTLEPVLTGDASDYQSMPSYRVRRGEHLDIADITPSRVEQVRQALAARRRLRATRLPPYQVSLPTPLDLAALVFGATSIGTGRLSSTGVLRALGSTLRHLPLFTTAIAAEIERIHHTAKEHHERVVIQLEGSTIAAIVDRAPHWLWPWLIKALVRHTAAVIVASPPDTTFVLHTWCRSDLVPTPAVARNDLTPLVNFANSLAVHLDRADRTIPALHVALCDEHTPPSTDERDYAPLAHLRSDIDLIAGLVDEHFPLDSETALALTERALSRPVAGLGAARALGPRTPVGAAANLALARRLSSASASAFDLIRGESR